MGTFIGHAVPGSFFFVIGSWWIVAVLFRYHRCRSKSPVQVFHSSSSFSKVHCSCGEIDVESIFGVSAAVLGMIIELILAEIVKKHDIGAGNMQHATMYFFFGLAASSNLLAPILRRHFQEADKIPYILITTALLVEGMLFKFHLFGRSPLDVTVHTLLLYGIWLSAAVTLAEMVYRNSILLALGRGFFTVLQGTWFWQTGFVLFNPLPGAKPWDEKDHEQLMLLACFFAWHVGVILSVITFISFLMSKVLGANQWHEINLHEMSPNQDNEHCVALLDDVEDGS